MTDSAERPAQPRAGAGLADIERALQGILQAVRDGQDDSIDQLVNQVGELVESFEAAEADAQPQVVRRVRSLFKQTALALATAGQQARARLRRVATGKKSLRAYRS